MMFRSGTEISQPFVVYEVGLPMPSIVSVSEEVSQSDDAMIQSQILFEDSARSITSSVIPLTVTDFTRTSDTKPAIGDRTHCFSRTDARESFAQLTVSFAD